MQELPNSLRTEASSPLRRHPTLQILMLLLVVSYILGRTHVAPTFSSSPRACAQAAGDITQTCIDDSAFHF